MYPSSTPLVPDDRYHEREFAPRDLDADRDLQRARGDPAPKRDEKTLRREPNGPVGEPVFGGGSDWRWAYAGRAILR
jgi:hypothetical protein